MTIFQETLASAPGKCILTGEHAVVYDAAALVIAINLRAYSKIQTKSNSSFTFSLKNYDFQETITDLTHKPKNKQVTPLWEILKKIYSTYELSGGLSIEIWSDIPIGVGLGSSAATSVAVAGALNNIFDLKLEQGSISQLAYEGERITHGTPSGVDNNIVTYGGAILYKNQKLTRLEVPMNIPILIINSGISRSTKTQVDKVKKLVDAHPSIFKSIFHAIDAISLKAEHAIRIHNLEMLGSMLTYNQHLLRLMGVSTRELDAIIELAESGGALGAKLTGAGGGGCLIAIFESDTAKSDCINMLNSKKIEYFNTNLSEFGVKIEHTLK